MKQNPTSEMERSDIFMLDGIPHIKMTWKKI